MYLYLSIKFTKTQSRFLASWQAENNDGHTASSALWGRENWNSFSTSDVSQISQSTLYIRQYYASSDPTLHVISSSSYSYIFWYFILLCSATPKPQTCWLSVSCMLNFPNWQFACIIYWFESSWLFLDMKNKILIKIKFRFYTSPPPQRGYKRKLLESLSCKTWLFLP